MAHDSLRDEFLIMAVRKKPCPRLMRISPWMRPRDEKGLMAVADYVEVAWPTTLGSVRASSTLGIFRGWDRKHKI